MVKCFLRGDIDDLCMLALLTSSRRIRRTMVFFIGTLPFTIDLADASHSTTRMRGPDFVMANVIASLEHPGSQSKFELADGSKWRIDSNRHDYRLMWALVERAKVYNEPLLVSGNSTTGEVDRLASTRRLAVQEVASLEQYGRYAVLFHGPPSVYRVRMNLPGARQALALLRQSAVSGASFGNPDLLVGIDTLASEIVAVKGLR